MDANSNRYTKTFTITPSDTVPLNGGQGTRGILALTSGDVDLLFQEDVPANKLTLTLTAGTIYPFSLRMVYTTSVGTVLGLL